MTFIWPKPAAHFSANYLILLNNSLRCILYSLHSKSQDNRLTISSQLRHKHIRRVVDCAFIMQIIMHISSVRVLCCSAAVTSKSQSVSLIVRFYPLKRKDLSSRHSGITEVRIHI